MRVVIAGGGTGGHLFPALALAEEFKRRGGQTEIIFVGSRRGLEKTVVPSHGYVLETLDVEGIKKRKGAEKIRAVFKAAAATMRAILLLRKIRPDGVIGSGSYSSGPVVLAARILGIKVRVISCIWVTAWKMLTSRPISSPAPNKGAESSKVIFIDSRQISSTNSWVIIRTLLAKAPD